MAGAVAHQAVIHTALHTPYEGDSEVLWGDPRGTHHEI